MAGLGLHQLGCTIIDLRMPGVNGLELQARIKDQLPHLAVVFLTGQAEIPDSVHAMKAGALDFLQKPLAEQELFAAIRHAVERTRVAQSARDDLQVLHRKYQMLTAREREVFALVTGGLLNKQIAFNMGAAERTIKAHRRHVMEKLDADSLTDLVRIADQLGIERISKERRAAISGRRFVFPGEVVVSKPRPRSSSSADHLVPAQL
ncbi:MAG: response regulator transcription factor [Deltaproteobacteria bacterium]|nr:response regulator transcription factor [Deltaproteobacteria bacterium]